MGTLGKPRFFCILLLLLFVSTVILASSITPQTTTAQYITKNTFKTIQKSSLNNALEIFELAHQPQSHLDPDHVPYPYNENMEHLGLLYDEEHMGGHFSSMFVIILFVLIMVTFTFLVLLCQEFSRPMASLCSILCGPASSTLTGWMRQFHNSRNPRVLSSTYEYIVDCWQSR